MPRIVKVPLSSEEKEQLIHLTKDACHYSERERAQTMLWRAGGEVSKLQHRIPETIRLQHRYWELYQFN